MGEPVLLQIPFGGGVHEKIAPEHLDPSQFVASVVNGNFTKNGAIDKRLGMIALCNSSVSPGASLSGTGVSIGSWARSNIVATTIGQLYTVNTLGKATNVSPLPSVYPVRRPITNTPSSINPALVDVSYQGRTLRVSIVQDAARNLVATVIDADTGDLVKGVTTVFPDPGGTYPSQVLQALYLPNAAASLCCLLTFINPNTGQISCANYDPTTNSFSSWVNLVTTSGPADVTPFNGDPAGGFILFFASSGAPVFQYLLPDLTLVKQQLLTALPGGTSLLAYNATVVATYGASEKIWLLYCVTAAGVPDIWVDCYTGDKTWTQLSTQRSTTYFGVSSQRWITGACRYDANTVLYGYTYVKSISDGGGTRFEPTIGAWALATTSGVTSTGDFPMGAYPLAAPYQASDGSFYQPFMSVLEVTSSVTPYSLQSQQVTAYLCKWVNFTNGSSNSVLPVATVAPRQVQLGTTLLALLYAAGRIPLNSVSRSSQTRYAFGFRTKGNGTAEVSGSKGPAWAADMFFDTTSCAKLYKLGELGNAMSVSSGVPFAFDSIRAFEHGFFQYPEFAWCSQSGSGGTLTGTYTYAVVYAYVDASGAIHRSSPTICTPITISGTQKVSVNIPVLSMTWRDYAKAGQVFAEIYRTVSNGSIFYFVDRVTISGFAASSTQYVTYGPDTETDAHIQTASLLYTTGGVLSNANPPAFLLQTIHRGRIVGVDETLKSMWFSKRLSAGDAPGFNETLVVDVPDGGDITAIASLDDALYIFKRSSIWVMFGDGPSDNGQGSDWTIPTPIASDVGCVDARSVAVTDTGIFFQASNGIHVLTRARTVEYIGRNVEKTLTAYPVITSAAVIPSSTQVRFTCTPSGGGAGVTVVYDYDSKCWGTHLYGLMANGGAAACVTQSTGRYVMMTTEGYVWIECQPTDSTAYQDSNFTGATGYFTTSVTTGWIKMIGLQNFLRVKRILLFAEQTDSKSGVVIALAFNYDGTVKQTATYLPATVSAYPTVQASLHVAPPFVRCESVQVTVSDYLSGGGSVSGSGVKFTGIGVEALPVSARFRRIPPALRQ